MTRCREPLDHLVADLGLVVASKIPAPRGDVASRVDQGRATRSTSPPVPTPIGRRSARPTRPELP